MQVTHVNEHVTHALIGGGKTIEFGITNSAEFMHILRSTLYSNQKLAVVRETICNAWDAHIEAGLTDTPINITLDESELIIRDYGLGIADEDMEPVYGTYGNSTKKANGTVTGGFGLGCKAPFAYADHFEVISNHAGKRTIYNLAKSSAEREGKSGITPIASLPTTEQGLQVKIPLNSVSDYSKFNILIELVIAYGDIKANLNGIPLKTIPFSTLKEKFLIGDFSGIQTLYGSDSTILLRYGNVVYPVSRHEDYSREYDRIERILGTLYIASNYSHRHIVFQADPNTIAVTPSRESLSMQEHTIRTVKKLLTEFLQRFDDRFAPVAIETSKEIIKSLLKDKNYSLLFTPGFHPTHEHKLTKRGGVLRDHDSIIRNLVSRKYPKELKWFRKEETNFLLDRLIEAEIGNPDLIRSFKSERMRSLKAGKLREPNPWLHKKVIFPLVQALAEDPELVPARLMAHGPEKRHPREKPNHLSVATKFKCSYLDRYIPFLRNILVLSYNQDDVHIRLHLHPLIKETYGDKPGYLVYRVPRNLKKVTAARAFFEKQGFVLIDLTVPLAHEKPVDIKPIPRTPAIPKRKGLPLLSGLVSDGEIICLNKLTNAEMNKDLPYTEEPKLVVLMTGNRATRELPGISKKATKLIIKAFGDDIAVARHSSQLKRYIEAGAKDLMKVVADKVAQETVRNKQVRNHIKYGSFDLENHWNLPWQLKSLFQIRPELLKLFGVNNNLTEENKLYLSLLEELKSYPGAIKELLETWQELAKLPRSQKVVDAVVRMETCELKGILNLSAIYNEMKKHLAKGDETSLAEVKKLSKIIQLAI